MFQLGRILLVTFGLGITIPGWADAVLPKVISGHNLNQKGSTEIDLTTLSEPLVVLFLSAKCPCSIGHESALEELSKEYLKKGYRFLGIHSNSDESEDFGRAHFQKAPLSFTVLQDEKSKLANAFGAFKTPHVFIVAKNQTLLFQGGVDSSSDPATAERHFLADALKELSQGKEVSNKKARSLGCVIKRDE